MHKMLRLLSLKHVETIVRGRSSLCSWQWMQQQHDGMVRFHRCRNMQRRTRCTSNITKPSTLKSTSKLESESEEEAASILSARSRKEIRRQIGQPSWQTHPFLVKRDEITPGITRDEFAQRRRSIMEKLPENSTLIVMAAKETYMTHDIPYPFRQDTEFLYLTGFQEPESVLVLTKGTSSSSDNSTDYQYTLFVRKRDPNSEQWDGPRAGIDGALVYFQADAAFHIDELEDKLFDLIDVHSNHPIFVASPSDRRFTNHFLQATKRFHERFQSADRMLQELRLRKSQAEQMKMRESCDLAALAFVQAMQTMRSMNPPLMEYEVGSAFESCTKQGGAERLSFPPVLASGRNAAIIHYIQNKQRLQPNELFLMDAGCERHGYASDITRTWPVNGTFTPSQAKLYTLVYECQLACIALAAQCHVRSVTLNDIHKVSVEHIAHGLRALNILSAASVVDIIQTRAYFPYYPTHVGHYLGLDTHDTPLLSKDVPLQEGMIFTIEPGLYFPLVEEEGDGEGSKQQLGERHAFEGMAVRIEDDILITKDGIEILTARVPKSISEIENLMKQPPST